VTTMEAEPARKRAVVVMGVSGCGKTVVGEALARRLGWTFIEGDRLHPPENIQRMASGQPLTDAHRAGWLDAIGEHMARTLAEGKGVVAACSALKRIYRDRLRGIAGPVLFAHLEVSPDVARERVSRRRGHFMPASLVESQFADLQRPQPDEEALSLDSTLPVDDIVARIVHRLNRS
jgi:gluconokinase